MQSWEGPLDGRQQRPRQPHSDYSNEYQSANGYATENVQHETQTQSQPIYSQSTFEYPNQQQQAGATANCAVPQSHATILSYVAPPQFINPMDLQKSSQAVPQAQLVAPAHPSPQIPSALPQTRPVMGAQAKPRPDSRAIPAPKQLYKIMKPGARRLSHGSAIAQSSVSSMSSSQVDTLSVLLWIAEDHLARAKAAARDVAGIQSQQAVDEHHQLVATGLNCLELALQSNKLQPRLEARIRLKYADILMEETDNLMETEIALTKGLHLCTTHRFTDLAYISKVLLAKANYRRNPKSALRAIDGHISDCNTYKHIAWVYAFRFLKAAFFVQAGQASDHNALENLRAIATLAQQRRDFAIFVWARLLEAQAHFNAMKPDAITRVQHCLADSLKYQFIATIHIPQLDLLMLLLDLGCALCQRSRDTIRAKLEALDKRMLQALSDPAQLQLFSCGLRLPMERHENESTAQMISKDTREVIFAGDGSCDYLVFSTSSLRENFAIIETMKAITAVDLDVQREHCQDVWHKAVSTLLNETSSIAHGPAREIGRVPSSLYEAFAQTNWDADYTCYALVTEGLWLSSLGDWPAVHKRLERIQAVRSSSPLIARYALFLRGCLSQGTGNLRTALRIWNDKQFHLDPDMRPSPRATTMDAELSILAALNQVWLRRETSYRDDEATDRLIERLKPMCTDHPNKLIDMFFFQVMASGSTPENIVQSKDHISRALSMARELKMKLHISRALCFLRSRIFDNLTGEQPKKAAAAAALQASKAGNKLWTSAAEGMLAETLEASGVDRHEVEQHRRAGTALARDVLRMADCYKVDSVDNLRL